MSPKTGQPADEEAIVRSILAESYVDLLGACGLSAFVVDAPVPAMTDEGQVAGFIGFTGSVRGRLIIAASCALYRITYPLGEGRAVSTSAADILDWAGEMANQTLGRVKRRFCERGVDFEISTPKAAFGRDFQGLSPHGDAIDVLVRVGAEIISIEFEIVGSGDGAILRDGVAPIACASEGEVVIF